MRFGLAIVLVLAGCGFRVDAGVVDADLTVPDGGPPGSASAANNERQGILDSTGGGAIVGDGLRAGRTGC